MGLAWAGPLLSLVHILVIALTSVSLNLFPKFSDSFNINSEIIQYTASKISYTKSDSVFVSKSLRLHGVPHFTNI